MIKDVKIRTAIKKSAESCEALCQKIVIAQDGRAYFEKVEPFINIISTQQKWTDIAAELHKTPFQTVSVRGSLQKSKMRLAVRIYLQMLNRRWLRHKEVFSVSDYERLTARKPLQRNPE